VPTLGNLGAELSLFPLGLALAAGHLARDVPLLAGDRIDAGVDDDLPAAAALSDHPRSPRVNDEPDTHH
jgi:hypothetical protein